MARTTYAKGYSGRAQKPLEWEVLQQIFDAIWEATARQLPHYPEVIGGVFARWLDISGAEHRADTLDEVEQAYKQYLTGRITFSGKLEHSPECTLIYWPAIPKVEIHVRATEEVTADKIITIVSKEFSLPDLEDEERQSLEKQRQNSHRRLRKLQEQRASMGYNTPPEVLNEIEDIQRELQQLDKRLGGK